MNSPISGRVCRLLLSAPLMWAVSGEAIAATIPPTFERVQALRLDPREPRTKLLEVNGEFYGTSSLGGAYDLGTLYKMTPDGTVTVLVNFNGTNGSTPRGDLALGPDGAIYGVTQYGTTGTPAIDGTAFRYTPGVGFTSLANFNKSGVVVPLSGLTLGSDGNFYGTTKYGGGLGRGGIYRLTTSGTITQIAGFNGTNGQTPTGRLVEGASGVFYGTCQEGGASSLGTVFSVTTAGVLTRLASLTTATGTGPVNGLVPDGLGNFFGIGRNGGISQMGTIFRVTPAGVVTNVVNFDPSNGNYPMGELTVAPDGNIYGTGGGDNTVGTYGTVFRLTPAGVLTVVGHLKASEGVSPQGGVAYGSDGNLYGVASAGGGVNQDYWQNGSIFRMNLQGQVTVLHGFREPYGKNLVAGLALGQDGNLYGATSTDGPGGAGAFLRMTPQGALNVVYACDNTTGFYPNANFTPGTGSASGLLFGTTTTGGNGANGTVVTLDPATQTVSLHQKLNADFYVPLNSQTVGPVVNLGDKTYALTSMGGTGGKGTFVRMQGGTATVLANFSETNGTTPYNPLGGPTWAGGSTFYATTSSGGAKLRGTLFKIDGETGAMQTLVTFTGPNGANPVGELLLVGDGITGTFYGVTYGGGSGDGGTIFKMTPDGALTTLVNFSRATSGVGPRTGLTLGPDGNFYGTTERGGTYDCGTAFQMTPAGVLTTVATFDGNNGKYPWGRLTQGPDGHLYGTTKAGGLSADGAYGGGGQIFRLRIASQVLTGTADPVTPFSAELHGTVIPLAQGAAISFQYGTDPTLATASTLQAGTPGGLSTAISASPGGLAYGTTYYYRAVAETGGGTFYGDIQSFTTPIPPPDIRVDAPGDVELASGGPAIVLENTTLTGTRDVTFTLRNTGPDSTLSEITATLAQPDGGAFSIIQQPAATLASGSTTTIVVRFQPGAIGGFTDVLTITSDDPDEGAFTIPLRGWGGLVLSPVIDPANPDPVEWDGFTATGITLSGTTLTGPPHRGTEYVILDNPGAAAVTGTFDGLPEGSLVTLTYGGNNYRFLLSYEGGDGNDIVLSYWPETGIDPSDSPEAFLFAALDSDRDDQLTLTEWQGIYAKIPKKEAIFSVIDTDKNGFLSFEEFAAGATNRIASRTITTAVNRTAIFMEVDTSFDNIVSRAEIGFMWKPGTAAKTIDAYWTRAKGGDGMDFWEWLWASTLPSFTTYDQASTLRAQRLAIATQLDTDTSGTITFAEFSHLYKAGTKTTTIDTAWRAANATPRGTASPADMTINAFVEAAKLPKLTVF